MGLFHRYIINAGDEKNKNVWNACVKKEINTCLKDAATEATSTVDDEKRKESHYF